MLAMSLRAFGAMMTCTFSPAIASGFCHDLDFDVLEESVERFFALQNDALALVDVVESLFGSATKHSQLRLALLILFFQKAQGLAHDFAGVRVAPRGNLTFDKVVKMLGQI